ncbi:MAG: molecular chaperone, partial [Clostridia bacterium]|nr:molecular chaperone [Clostridia bacterium]
RSSGSKTDIFNQNTLYSRVTNENETILEVKYTGFLPNHIKRMLQVGDTNRESFSKYTMCRLNSLAI